MVTTTSLDDIYADIKPDLWRFLSVRIGNQADAEDLVQEVFIKYQETSESTWIDNPRGFLFSIARNLSIDLIRQTSRSKAREVAYSHAHIDYTGDDFVDPTPNAEAVLLWKQEEQRFLCVVGGLSPRVREAFILHKLDGYSYSDAAHQMGISKSTLEKHMIKALGVLSASLRE